MTGDVILAGGFDFSLSAERYLTGMVISPLVLFGVLALSVILIAVNAVFFLPPGSRLSYVGDAFIPWRFYTKIESEAALWVHSVVLLIKLLGLIALALYAFVYAPSFVKLRAR
jgi:hypothetical protein